MAAAVVCGSATSPAELPQFPDRQFNVRDFGAKGDSETNDTAAINAALERCAANGGGTLFFPAGTYAAASIHLRSNVRLQLDPAAVIRGARAGYDAPEPTAFERYQDFGHSHFHNALMWGENIENFALVGGRVNGDHLVEDERDDAAAGDKVIAIKSGRKLRFENVTHEKGAHFVYLLNDCEDVTFAGVRIEQSRDGINLVSCRNVEISGCRIAGCGDDALALKSDYALGRKIPTAEIKVSDSEMDCAGSALQIGSESVGDFHHIAFQHISVKRAEKAAVGIVTSDGGVVDGVSYSNLLVRRAACPVYLRVNERLRSGEAQRQVGAIRNVRFTQLDVRDPQRARDVPVSPSIIVGQASGPIENISFVEAKIVSAGGGARPESFELPAAKGHGHKAFAFAPAAAVFLSHARNVTLRRVELSYANPDARPSIVARDVAEFTLEDVRAQKTGPEFLHLENVDAFLLRNSPPWRDRREEHVASLAVGD